MKIKHLLYLFFLINSMLISAQEIGLKLMENVKSETIPFQLIKNLVVIPVELNGHDMNFIVDSGLREIILFSQFNNALDHKTLQKVNLKGLGNNEEGTIGYYSSENSLFIGENYYSTKTPIIIIQDQNFDLFSRLGIDVHGIIGYEFFRNYPVKIDYSKGKITIYKSILNVKKIKKYESDNLEISAEKKPFLNINFNHYKDYNNQKMLIDIGNSDGLWLFKNEIDNLHLPNNVFYDELGKGFNGIISGERGTVNRVNIGKYEFEQPLIAIPNPESIQFINVKNNRKGSVGNEILRRFTLILDYNNAKIYYKPNKNFDDAFHYNRSGLTIVHANFEWKKESIGISLDTKETNENDTKTTQKMNYQYVMKPIYKIETVRKKSNAEFAGLKANDQLEKLNGKNVSKMTLTDIENFMRNNEHQEISIEILRNNQSMKFKFILDIPFTN